MKKVLSLLEHIEKIVELSEKSKLSDKFYKEASAHLDVVCKTLELNSIQAIVFSHLVGMSDDKRIYMKEIADKLQISTIRMLQYLDDIDGLERLRLVRCSHSDESTSYRMPKEVIDALRKGQKIQPTERKNLSVEIFFDELDQLFKQLREEEIGYDLFDLEIENLLNDNEHLLFVQKIKYLYSNVLHVLDLRLLLRFCNLYVENRDDTIGFHDLEDYFSDRCFRRLKREMSERANDLIAFDWIEYVNDNGFEDRTTFKLTDKAKTELLSELNLQSKKANQKDILQHHSLAVKQMYYNDKEQRQIKQLSDLLSEENFANVQKRLQDKGMRTGFVCLFHGAPGTGKTETVYQIARQTGRNIFLVDISETKSMWFGESEKKIKEVFEKYKSFVKSEKTTPILLFNEADAVIGKRKDAASSNVAQTENAMQNIILQEMENLEGIMIATTNLTQNLDKAFERRFLYKIEFEKPDTEAKCRIWQSIIPVLTEAEAAELSRRFDFSGGQIENIARKCTVDSIILGNEPNLDTLVFHCQNELIANNRKTIGFRSN